MKSAAQNKNIVEGVVTDVFHFGAFVTLLNGSLGYIRQREMSWSMDVDPLEVVQVGQRVKAQIIENATPGLRFELSLRPFLLDPWIQFSKQYRVDDMIHGRVKDIQNHGIFVEIIPGVNGYVSLNELSLQSLTKPEELVWLDDHVEAIITAINIKKKNVRLSVRKRLASLSLANNIIGQLRIVANEDKVEPKVTVQEIPKLSLECTEIQAVGEILIIEDQEDLRSSLEKWLVQQGFSVQSVDSAKRAREIICTIDFGVCFVDIDLPDGDGLELVKKLKEVQPDAHVFVMSVPDWLVDRTQELEALDITAFFFKPLKLEEIIMLLTQISRGEVSSRRLNLFEEKMSGSGEAAFKSISKSMNNYGQFNALEENLDNVLQLTHAELAVLFHHNKESRILSVLGKVGRASLTNDEALYSLSKSIVVDVISRGEVIHVNQVTEKYKMRFRKLQEFFPFESAIGVPIQVGEFNEHALFIFHRQANKFSPYRKRDVMAFAPLFAAYFEKQMFIERIRMVGGLMLSGQLAAGLGHEVFNRVSALEIQLLNLHHDVTKRCDTSSDRDSVNHLQETKGEVNGIVKTVVELKNTIGLFQSLMNIEEVDKTTIDQVINDAKLHLLPILGRDKIQLKVKPFDKSLQVPGNPTHLRQVVLNIFLNAIQHISIMVYGLKKITVKVEFDDGERPLKIRISDSGPGIHRKHWEKIFSLGFSTRAEGTGLGLYIARSLIEHMGGILSLEESTISLGSTFLIELPVLN